MEKKDLSDLVNEVDKEAQEFISFDDYIKSKGNGSGEEKECKKPAPDAVVNSPSKSSTKAGDPVDSSTAASVEAASPESDPKEKTWAIGNPTKQHRDDVGGHPHADPNAVWPEAPYKPIESAPVTRTVLDIRTMEWNGQVTAYVNEIVEKVSDDQDNRLGYIDGRDFSAAAASYEEIIERFHKIGSLMLYFRDNQYALRVGLEKKLEHANHETRDKAYKALNRANKSNAKAAERMKAERAPKEKVTKAPLLSKGNTKLVDGFIANGFPKEMVINLLKMQDKLDEATINYVNLAFQKKGN